MKHNWGWPLTVVLVSLFISIIIQIYTIHNVVVGLTTHLQWHIKVGTSEAFVLCVINDSIITRETK